MTAVGKTIRIYLADGTPGGIRHAELMNWSGQASKGRSIKSIEEELSAGKKGKQS